MSHRFYIEPNNSGSYLTLDSMAKEKKDQLVGIHWNEDDAVKYCAALNVADNRRLKSGNLK